MNLNLPPQASFGRRGRPSDEPVLSAASMERPRLLIRRDEVSIRKMFFSLDGRIGRKRFFSIFVATTLCLVPGLLSLIYLLDQNSLGAHARDADFIFRAVACGAMLILPIYVQLLYFVKRMHDHGHGTDQGMLLFLISSVFFFGPAVCGYSLGTALTLIVYFGFAFSQGSNEANVWGDAIASEDDSFV